MFLNINHVRVKLEGIIAYGPYNKVYPNKGDEFGICIYYENKDVEIPIPKQDIEDVLKRIDDFLSK